MRWQSEARHRFGWVRASANPNVLLLADANPSQSAVALRFPVALHSLRLRRAGFFASGTKYFHGRKVRAKSEMIYCGWRRKKAAWLFIAFVKTYCVPVFTTSFVILLQLPEDKSVVICNP